MKTLMIILNLRQAEIVIDITSFTKWLWNKTYQFLDLLYEKNGTNLSVLDRSSNNILFFILNLIQNIEKNYKLQIAQESKLKILYFQNK